MKSDYREMIVCLVMIAVALTPSRAQGATFAARDFSTANKVTFLSEGEKIVAFLFTPPGFDPTSKEKLPAVAFIGPMSGLKDQVTCGRYPMWMFLGSR